MTVENVTYTSVKWQISTNTRDVTLVEILLTAKNVKKDFRYNKKTSDITHYLFGIRSSTLERNRLNVKSVGKA